MSPLLLMWKPLSLLGPLPRHGEVLPLLSGSSSISSCVAARSQPFPGSVSHCGLLPCPRDSSVGTGKGNGAGRKGSITVTNNCLLTN